MKNGSELTFALVFALFMLLGFFATLLIPETKGISLEDLSNEDQTNFVGGEKSDRRS